MGRPQHPGFLDRRATCSRSCDGDRLNVFTLHAEIEGMGRRSVLREFLGGCRDLGVEFVRLDEEARRLLADRAAIPVCEQVMAPVDGRSGLVATQGPADGRAP